MAPDTALDIDRTDDLVAYLRESGRIPGQARPTVTPLAGGVSNRTVLVEVSDGPAFVVKQALERLRVAVEWHSDPRRVEREALGLEWLARLAPAGTITPLLFLDKEHHLLGMKAVPRPHVNWKAELLAGHVEKGHVEQFGRILAAIHRNSQRQAPTLASLFEERSFFESLRLEPYYRFTAGQVPAAASFLDRLIADTWLTRLTLVHGDYSPKNILIHRDKLVLLDHEVIHFGDPAFDLGFSLAHLLSKAHHLPQHRPALLEAARCYWAAYVAEADEIARLAGFEERVARHTLGCLLARVAGRSPLEYLNASERSRQTEVVLGLLGRPPQTVESLVGLVGRG